LVALIHNRLLSPGITPNGATITLSFEGQALAARDGESLAAALTAAGHLALRQAGEDDRRGLFCGMGACQECLVEIDGRGGQRACMTKAVCGMTVRRHDPATAQLAPLGHRPAADPPVENCDVAIIGAGPAGLAAADVLARNGIKPILIDEREQPGGQYFKPLAASHRFTGRGEDRQFATGRRRVATVRALGADIRNGQTVWQGAAEADGTVSLGIQTRDSAYLLRAKTVLVATGAYERPYPVPGWTLPGVMTAGAAQTLARSYRVTPGQRVLVAGNGPLNWQVALEIARGGGHIVGVLESAVPMRATNLKAMLGMFWAAPRMAIDGAIMRLALMKAGIAVLQGFSIAALEGNGRVERATAISANKDQPPRIFEVDAVCLGYGFTPNVELIRMLGCPVTVNAQTGYAVPDLACAGRAGDKAIWVAGDAGGIGGSQVAQQQGIASANAMIAYLRGNRGAAGPPAAGRSRAERFQQHLWSLFAAPAIKTGMPPDTIICRCENITAKTIIDMRAGGVSDLGSLKRRTRLGMGRCQGRYCSGAALKLLRQDDLSATTEADLIAPQAPARPVPAILLASEKPEWGGHREVETAVTPANPFLADPLPTRCDLLVIGAGITGASTAMFAARHGMDTVVIDRSAPNSQASGGNAGSLHVQLLSWDFGKKAMAGGHPALQTLALQRDSVALWKSLESELAADFEIVTTGGLMVAENTEQTAFLKNKAAAERLAGIDVEVLGRDELAVLAPEISSRMLVAAYCAAEGKINPLKATPAIVTEAERHGARFFAGHDVQSIVADGDGYLISTGSSSIRARRVVIAAGGWSRRLGRMVGAELPISGAPLQMLVTEPTRPILKQLIAHADRHLTMKQAANGNFIIGGAWTADTHPVTGYARVLRTSIEGNLWVAERTVPSLAGLHLLRSWASMNINIDGAPLLGEIPGAPGVFIAATANGYTLGPIMGQLTAELVTGGKTRRDLAGFTLERFP
jgi:glycine/D-amino acid oxidase-like deaminating enzyme